MFNTSIMDVIQVIHPGKGNTLIIYADIGPSHSKRLLKPTSNIDEHHVLYSVLNQASLQQPDTKKPEYDPCSIGECYIITLGAHAQQGYNSQFVCVCVCLCICLLQR